MSYIILYGAMWTYDFYMLHTSNKEKRIFNNNILCNEQVIIGNDLRCFDNDYRFEQESHKLFVNENLRIFSKIHFMTLQMTYLEDLMNEKKKRKH